jgi:mRNA interferase HigB
MRVIKKLALVNFWEIHSDAKASLTSWHSTISKSDFSDFNDLRKAFRQVDYVEGKYVFNAGSHRLIAAIHFNTQKVFIRHVLTHVEYDRGKWKKT